MSHHPSPTGDSRLPDLVRRARRLTGLSQRGLADQLGVSHSTVARWETGVTSPDLATFGRLTDLAGLRLVAVDSDGSVVEPMRADAARDRAGRRYPSHLDPHAREWRVPSGVHMTGDGIVAWWRAIDDRLPRVRFEHAAWRDLLRGLLGVPSDHPTREALVAEVRAWLGETSGDEPEAPD